MRTLARSLDGVRARARRRLYAAVTAGIVLGASAPAFAEANNSAGGSAGGAFQSSYSTWRVPAQPQYQPPAAFSRSPHTGRTQRYRR
jgi:hypothetical protein